MNEPLLEVGRVARPHGLRGDVVVELTTNRAERVAPGSVLEVGDGGPLVVERSSPHLGRFIVHFSGIDSVEAAGGLRGAVVRAEPLEDPDVLWVHELVGAEVLDQEGRARGRVERVQENPASDLLVLEDGTLVPLTFVVDHVPGVSVTVEVPEGLFDL